MNAQLLDKNLPPAPLSAEAQGVLSAALSLCDDSLVTITTADEAEEAGAELQTIKGAIKRVEDCRFGFTRPLDELKKKWTDFFRPTMERLQQREDAYKTAILGFQAQERRRVEAERQENERKAREEQERLRKAAEKDAKKLEKKGDAEAAQAVRDAVPDVVAAAPVAAPTKLAGTATREVWKGEVTDMKALCHAIADGLAPEELVTINQSALNKMAGALKRLFKVPGCRAFSEEQLASRRV